MNHCDFDSGPVSFGQQSNVTRPWYALHVLSKMEKLASTALRKKGYEEFLPLYRSRRQWSDRVKVLDLPLFPGYFFCRLDVSSSLLPVVSTHGVLSVVSAGKTPAPVPDQEIHNIQQVLSSGLPVLPYPGLCSGSRVLIEHGPLAGVEGTVLDVNKKWRLIVSVPLLQRSVAVEIDRDWVRPVSAVAAPPVAVPLGYHLRTEPS